MFDAYNELCSLLFHQRGDYEKNYKQNLPAMLRHSKRLGLQLMKGQLQPQNLKKREEVNALKEKVFNCWCRVLQEQNQADETTFPGRIVNEQTRAEMAHEQAIVANYMTPE